MASTAPFGACYRTKAGADVAVVDLEPKSNRVYWRIHKGNYMVTVKRNVLCLGSMTEQSQELQLSWEDIC